MKKSVKFLSLMSTICLMSAGLLSCGSFNKGGDGEGGGTDEPVVIDLDSDYKGEISLLIPTGNENETTMIDELIKEFNLDYPNVTFNKKSCSVSGYENTVRNQWIAKSLPDIVWSNSPDFYSLVGQEIALPLNGYIEACEAAGTFNFKSDFLTEFFDMGAVNGKYYCFPRSCDSVVTFYNKKLLSDAGVDTSKIKNGWSWDDFMSVMAEYRTYLNTTKNKDTYYALDANLTTWLSTCYPMLRSYGADVINENKECLIDSPETRECLELVKDMMTKGYIVPSGVTSGSSFESGTSPFLFQSSAISLYAERKALKGNIDIVSFPLINKKSTPKIGSGIAGYCINSRTEKEKRVACWKFMEKMISKTGQQAMAKGGLNLPSVRKDLQDYKTDNTIEWSKGYESYNLDAYTFGGEYKITSDFLSRVDVEYKAKLDEATRGLFDDALREDKTIEQAITTCAKAIKNAVK